MKLDILDDVVYIEIGRTLSDSDYGNWKLSIRIPVRHDTIDSSIDGLKDYLESKLDTWKTARMKRRDQLNARFDTHETFDNDDSTQEEF